MKMAYSTLNIFDDSLILGPTPTQIRLLDSDPDREFDAITCLAAELFEVPVSLISIIDDVGGRQFFKSQVGLPETWAGKRETPLSHSFCQYVRNSARPFVVNDAQNHAIVRENSAITDLDVKAYLGVPIFAPEGEALGALCVINPVKRLWTNKEVALLLRMAKCVSNEIRLQSMAETSQKLFFDLRRKHEETERYNALREKINSAFMAPDLSQEDRFQAVLKCGCEALGMERGVITKVDYNDVEPLFEYNKRRVDPVHAPRLPRTLTSYLISGRDQFSFSRQSYSDTTGWTDFRGHKPGSFAGVPLLIDGTLFGTLEISAQGPKLKPWSGQELSTLSMMSMMICVYLSFIGKIDALKRSEEALLNHILDGKARKIARPAQHPAHHNETL